MDKHGQAWYTCCGQTKSFKGSAVASRRKTIAVLLAEAAKLSSRAASLAKQGEIAQALAVEAEADKLRAEARSFQQNASASRSASSEATGATRAESAKNTRILTVSSLAEIGVPVSPRAVAEYASARFGKAIDYRSLATLRRDEQRAWSRSARAVYVVPALEGARFFPFRGKVALSDWPLKRRLIGPWSERVDHLHAIRNMARQLRWLRQADPAAGESLSRLLGSYASTVPGALKRNGGLDPEQLERALNAELAEVEPRDDTWRWDAARHAESALSPSEQVWGLRAPGLLADTGS